ncbi:MAG: DUF4198 domain-containing protein [Cyanothece sp. SIO1E1]|nr:DUF4198 domain-containing protein [Cyanothece sp. SIO1E1]
MKARLLMPLMLLTLLGLPTKALAHAVETNYLLGGNKLEFQSGFRTGEALAGATVKVYAPNNSTEPWMEGVTDEEGRFSFIPDASLQGDWKIKIGQGGHSDIWTVPVGADGIEADYISEGPKDDIHYAAPPLFLVGATAVVGGIGVVLSIYQRKR